MDQLVQQYSILKKIIEWKTLIATFTGSDDLICVKLCRLTLMFLDLKQAFPAQKPFSVAEFKQFCTAKWAKIPPQ